MSRQVIANRTAAVPIRALNLTLQGVERHAGLPTRRTLIRWVKAALLADAELTLRFVDRREGRRLNHDFRRRDYATNVLTFDYQRAPRVVADIVICVPVVRAEAQSQGKSLRAHLAHLVIHGTLHAQGFDHRSPRDARRMERLETQLLAELGYRDPYSTTAAGTGPRGPLRPEAGANKAAQR